MRASTFHPHPTPPPPQPAPARAPQSRRLQPARGKCTTFTLLLLTLLPATTHAAPRPAKNPAPASDEAFYEGLLELKLFDLLDYQLKIAPPADPLAALLLERRIHLAVADDELTAPDRRARALAQANDILAQLIRVHGTDARVLDWQLTLARSLIYEQAEPYYASILYQGGTAGDQTALRALMARATDTLNRLRTFLDSEYARIDELSLAEYERLDDSGYVTAIEEAMPQADYMMLWANFYSAAAMDGESPNRRALLEGVLNTLTKETDLLTAKHDVTHVQAQCLLLAGMTSRRLADYDSAVRYLQDAANVAAAITNVDERRDLQWIDMLAAVEQVRALRDRGDDEAAARAVADLSRRVARGGGDFGRRLVVAMLEASVELARENREKNLGADEGRAAPLTEQAAKPLMELARGKPAYRDQVYAALYRRLRDCPDPAQLHPFQQCALIAGHLAESTRLQHGADDYDRNATGNRATDEARAIALLDQAIELARGLLARRPALDDALACEAQYNLAVGEQLRGARLEAVHDFSSVATRCPRFPRALAAATYAVEIAVQLAEDPTLRARRDVQDAFVHALRTLDEQFPDSDAAAYWRFFLAQAFEDVGELDQAGATYARVSENHPNYLTARFRAARCAVASLTAFVTARSDDLVEIKRRAGEARRAVEHFQKLAADSAAADIRRLRAESEVLLAEMDVLPGVDRPAETLSVLADFEPRYPQDRDLIGRVLRARIVAYEATGQLAQAQETVPRYVASAPEEAGPTLQALFDATNSEIARLRKAGREDLAKEKARAAFLFAEQLFAWAKAKSPPAAPADLHLLRVQLADAYLEAAQPEQALPLFLEAQKEDAAEYGDGLAHRPRILLGLARTYELLGRYADALPLFNRAFNEAPQDAPHRFVALLGDLRCRTALAEDPQGIVDVIRQQRFLNPDLGGEQLKAEFAELQRRNEARLKQYPAARAQGAAPQPR